MRDARQAAGVSSSAEHAILDAALLALAHHGPKRLTISDVAYEAGMSRTTIYRYFETKDQLLDALMGRLAADLTLYMAREVEAVPDVAERFETALNAMEDLYASGAPSLSYLVESEPHFMFEFYREHWASMLEVTARVLEPILGDEVQARGIAEVLLRINVSLRIIGPDYGASEDRRQTLKMCVEALRLQQRPDRGVAAKRRSNPSRSRPGSS
ncbi:MAG TPA: TetR/AcrR family transcriptional regulator [Mycobacteriales bacterium]|nr:TetR/AcrR family transcriptional regulator [Mycobacteriales bacterium]